MNNISKKNTQNRDILTTVSDFISRIDLNDVVTKFDSKSGVASISGNKDGIQYTTTMKEYDYGIVETRTKFAINLVKDALTNQIKNLRNQGYKQTEIAKMLNISQSTVSKHLNKSK